MLQVEKKRKHSKGRIMIYISIGIVLVAVIAGLLILRQKRIKIQVMESYTQGFQKTFQDMRESYVLTDHKGIDWDALYEKYYPLVEKAEKEKDEYLFVNTMLDYSLEFKDSHIILEDSGECMGLSDSSVLEEVKRRRFPSNYGMAIMRLDSGDYVAVNVIEGGPADLAGIRELDLILSWNNTAVEELSKTVDAIPLLRWNYANSDNLTYLSPLYITVQSADQVEVELKDGRKFTMESSGNGYDYAKDTFTRLLTRVNQGENMDYSNGMMYYQMEEDYIYLRVSNLAEDDGSEFEKELSLMKAELDEKRMDFILIDMRNNSGGYDDRGAELLSYFVKEDLYYLSENTYSFESKTYNRTREIRVEAKNYFDLPVVMLVNSQCVSAGEAFTYHMSQLENVTVIGASDTNGSLATYKGYIFLPAGICIHYPYLLCKAEDGSVLIDAGVNCKGGVSPDYLIPKDMTFMKRMFVEDLTDDYEREYLLSLVRK